MSFVRRRLLNPVLGFLRQGVTPQKLALCVGFGLAFGSIPIIGVSTILCGIVAYFLRLNQPAIQTVNYAAAPLQIILLLPWIRMGEWLFRAQPLPLSTSQILGLIKADMFGAIQSLWWVTMRALAAWAITMPIVIALIYFLLTPVFRRVAAQFVSEPAPTTETA